MLCKPWYVGNACVPHPEQLGHHASTKDGKVVLKEKCFAIAAVDEELVQTRVGEKTSSTRRSRRDVQERSGSRGSMDSVGFALFGVDWEFIKPYIVLGLALGGVYALSGVGLVVLYQATGVLNLAFGAIGASGALIAYWMINHTSWPHWLAYATCVAFGGVVNLVYGLVFGPAFAARDPLVKMMGTLAWPDPARPDGGVPRRGAFNRVLAPRRTTFTLSGC
jgi:hypothetical protein